MNRSLATRGRRSRRRWREQARARFLDTLARRAAEGAGAAPGRLRPATPREATVVVLPPPSAIR